MEVVDGEGQGGMAGRLAGEGRAAERGGEGGIDPFRQAEDGLGEEEKQHGGEEEPPDGGAELVAGGGALVLEEREIGAGEEDIERIRPDGTGDVLGERAVEGEDVLGGLENAGEVEAFGAVVVWKAIDAGGGFREAADVGE